MSTDHVDEDTIKKEARKRALREEHLRCLEPLTSKSPHIKAALGVTLRVMLEHGVDSGAKIAPYTRGKRRTENDHVAALRKLFGDRLNDKAERDRLYAALVNVLNEWNVEDQVLRNQRKRRRMRKKQAE